MPRPDHELRSNGLHFGVGVRQGSIHGLYIDRATYTNVSRAVSDSDFYRSLLRNGHLSIEEAEVMFEDPFLCTTWREAYISGHVEGTLHNFDLNMMAFARIDKPYFEAAVEDLLKAFPSFEPVTDLTEWMDRQGLYLMVLDEYRQLYLGQSSGIGKRIRQHWSSSKRLDRLVFGSTEGSILSIDAFRARDTTRIYAWTDGLGARSKRDVAEKDAVAHVDPELSLNRIDGGAFSLASGIPGRGSGLKRRRLVATPEEWAAYWETIDSTPMGREVHPRGWRRTSRLVQNRTRPPLYGADEDPVGVLVVQANSQKRNFTILVDAGGTIIKVCDGAVPTKPDKYVQLFSVPCGMSVSREMMERALSNCRAFMGEKPGPPIPLFELVGQSGISVRVPPAN